MANKTKKSRFLTSFICIFVGVVLVFGIVMGVIIAINNSHAVVRSGSLTMEEGVVNYFASTFKITYIAGLKSSGVKGVKDDPDFWAATSDDGNTTWGDRLRAEFREYLSELMAANTIYNSRFSLDGGDRRIIEDTISDILKWRADGDKSKFNSLSEPFGFDYDDLTVAAEMEYKAEQSRILIYGADGTNLLTELAEEFLKKYSRVSLAFIRTDYKPVTDEITGEVSYEELLSYEIAEREEKISEIKSYVDNKNAANNGEWMTKTIFDEIMSSYEGDGSIDYYFHEQAESTKIFAEDLSEIVERAYQMKPSEYDYVECSIPADEERGYVGFKAACFIYKSEPAAGAYLDRDNEFLSDFYSIASDYYYSESIKEFSRDVEFTPLYDSVIDPVLIPVNNKLKINGWKN